MKASKTESTTPLGGAITITLFAVAAVWLALQLLAMRTLVASAVHIDPSEVANLVLGLSGLVVGIIFAGGVAGLAMVTGGRDSWNFLSRLPRIVTAALGGLGVAVVMAIAAFFTFAETPGLGVLIAGVAGVAGLLGGCLAALRSSHLVAAGLTGTAVLLVVFFLRGYFTTELLEGLGRDISAYRTLTIVGGLVAGLFVGLAAFGYLRRRSPQTGLYGYLLAGAAPGILWLIGEVITQIAAAQLVAPATEGQIDLDALSMQISAQSQFNGGMTALFAGATTAVLAFGLLLPAKKGQKNGRKATGKGAGKNAVTSPGKPTGKSAAKPGAGKSGAGKSTGSGRSGASKSGAGKQTGKSGAADTSHRAGSGTGKKSGAAEKDQD